MLRSSSSDLMASTTSSTIFPCEERTMSIFEKREMWGDACESRSVGCCITRKLKSGQTKEVSWWCHHNGDGMQAALW
eukprot:14171096-Ditylum_brightwellii.AAC.1